MYSHGILPIFTEIQSSSTMGKRELVALLGLSSWCLVIVVWLFLAVPWVCLQFVIVVFPDHTSYFYRLKNGHRILYFNSQGLLNKPIGVYITLFTTVVLTKSDSDVILCLQVSSKTLTCTVHFS